MPTSFPETLGLRVTPIVNLGRPVKNPSIERVEYLQSSKQKRPRPDRRVAHGEVLQNVEGSVALVGARKGDNVVGQQLPYVQVLGYRVVYRPLTVLVRQEFTEPSAPLAAVRDLAPSLARQRQIIPR